MALIDCCVACAVGWSVYVCMSQVECALTCIDDFGTVLIHFSTICINIEVSWGVVIARYNTAGTAE